MKKELKLGYEINLGFFGAIAIATALFLTLDCSPYITKTIASVLFVLCGVFNLIYAIVTKNLNKLSYLILMVVGLVFACLGDIFLIDYFLVGAILFAIGHIFFLISFFVLEKLNWRDVCVGLSIFAVALLVILLLPIFDFQGMKIMIIAYALIISLMLGKALSNVFVKENRGVNAIIGLGALMFFLSDLMLLFYRFGGAPKVCDYMCVGLYYPAEFLLAFSIMLVAFAKNNNEKINDNK